MSTPIFILSDYRSGSTMLRYVLDSHPAICCPAELVIAGFCQAAFHVIELTTDGMLEDPEALDRQRARSVRRLVDQIMLPYCHRKGKQRWCEKSPANTEALYVLATVFPDAQFICLYRHALDQVRSVLDIEGGYRLGPYLAINGGDRVASAIDRWCTSTERLLAFEHSHLASVRRVTYESIVNSPETELRALMRFLAVADVPNLSTLAFQSQHDPGPADVKIRATRAVERDRVGLGRHISLKYLRPDLHGRLARLLNGLGYE
jgi:protein-tyrosine sulfotransferase